MKSIFALVVMFGLVLSVACGDFTPDPTSTPPVVRPLAM